MIITGEPKAIAAAYIAARSEIESVMTKDAKGGHGKYVKLSSIIEAISPILFAHGLVLMQEPTTNEYGVGVSTSILHDSGASIDFAPLTMPLADQKPHTVGSALSYARRYAISAVFGLAADDDDGQAAQDGESRTRPAQKAATPPAAQLRRVNADTGEIVEPDVLFAKEEPPTDEEHDTISVWQSSQDAYTWAVNVGSCVNVHEAETSMKKAAKDKGLKFTTGNKAAIFLAFLRRQNEKMLEDAAAQEPIATVT